MLKFMHHEYDVLVATSIIENGLDIPLRQHHHHQPRRPPRPQRPLPARGRVGRSNRRAYAYLLIPPETELTEIARRRLAALKEFSDLGAGFKIAALDLELRGAGNMLGGEQSGHIEAVGFEMYTSMLEEAVRKMKGEEDKPAHAGTSINLRHLRPHRFRVTFPKRTSACACTNASPAPEYQAELEDVLAELKDRYGDPPESVLNLLAAGEVRLLCERLGIAQLDRKRTQIEAPRPAAAPSSGQQTMLAMTRRQPPPKPAAKVFVEMLHIRFAAAAADTSQLGSTSLARTAVDPAAMMKLVARNAKRGAQFTPRESCAGRSPQPRPASSSPKPAPCSNPSPRPSLKRLLAAAMLAAG